MAAESADEYRVYFGVFGFDDHAAVTALVGANPTRVFTKGELHAWSSVPATHNRWELGPLEYSSTSITTQISELVVSLEPLADGVRAAASQFEAGVMCAAKLYQDFNPDLHVSAEDLACLANLGLSLDFDLYFLGGD